MLAGRIVNGCSFHACVAIDIMCIRYLLSTYQPLLQQGYWLCLLRNVCLLRRCVVQHTAGRRRGVGYAAHADTHTYRIHIYTYTLCRGLAVLNQTMLLVCVLSWCQIISKDSDCSSITYHSLSLHVVIFLWC
jgi:hypothetical protein